VRGTALSSDHRINSVGKLKVEAFADVESPLFMPARIC
jgi:hypothetical protein